MKDAKDGPPTSPITVGDINGTGIVVGHGSFASVDQRQSSVQRDAIAMLDEFIRLLEIHQSSVADAPDIRDSAAAARTEITNPTPRWGAVRSLLRGILASVTGVSALADAICKIQALIAHISA
jgi:hypothetical protein